MRVAAASAVVVAALLAPAAQAGVILGVHGNAPRFASQTGQQSQIRLTFVSFAQGNVLGRVAASLGPVPTCAYNQNGTRRDAAHTTLWTRKALARIAVLLRGGTQQQLNAKLAQLGLPGLGSDLPVTTPKLRLVWNPQGFGSPDVPGNSAQAYYPGDTYVDVVGDDLYDMRGHGATWAAAETLYKAHPSKPFAFPEFGLWGLDDPQFIRDMASWVKKHRRIEFISYFSGRPGSVWDLATKPASRAAYRALITPLGTLP